MASCSPSHHLDYRWVLTQGQPEDEFEAFSMQCVRPVTPDILS